MRRVGYCCVAIATLTLSPLEARAENARRGPTLELGTDFPLSLGARSRVEVLGRLRLALCVGVLPGPYVDAINGTVIALGGYNEANAKLIRSALDTSLVVGPSVGFRFLRDWGFYAEGGYRFAGLGGSASAAELIAGLTGQPEPEGRAAARATQSHHFNAASTLHMLSLELGYEWLLAPHWSIRAALGGVTTVSTSNELEPDYEPRAPRALEQFANYGETYLDDLEQSYVHSPYLGVSVGYVLQ